MRFASLGSGSRGNSTVVDSGKTSLMIDCGFSRREVERRLSNLDFLVERLDAILVTHEHSDHISGVISLADKFDIAVYATHGTTRASSLSSLSRLIRFNAGEQFFIGDILIQSVSVPHDSLEACQYRLSGGGATLGILTDLGFVTKHVEEVFKYCDSLILEFNHDDNLLLNGPYPAKLKTRISGEMGHLSNVQAANFVTKIVRDKFNLMVAHVSEKNNTREIIRKSLEFVNHLPNCELFFAEQDVVSGWLEVSKRE